VLLLAIPFYLRSAAASPQQQPVSTETSAATQAEAKQTYESVCAACHGLDAHGGERGPNIASRPEVVRKTDTELAQILTSGKPAGGMPSFAAFGPTKISALVAYLRTLQGQGKALALPGDPARGKSLFFGKARCSQCHSLAGQGGFFASDLAIYSGKLDPGELRNKVISPDEDLDPRLGLIHVVLSDGTELTGASRNESNFTLQLQSPDGTFHLLNKSAIRSQTYLGVSGMPQDYGATLAPVEINDLVSLVMQSVSEHPEGWRKHGDDDDDEN
jgi:cytochrome c oxidase cbb3-type subunit III